MNSRNRLKRWLGLGLALGALSAPAAQAATRPDDRAGPVRAVGTAGPVPDVFERYAAAHPYGTGISATVSVVSGGGFDWGDYGAGVGTGIGAILLLAGGLTAVPARRRQRIRTARRPAIGSGVG
jgi:hypothetical protein